MISAATKAKNVGLSEGLFKNKKVIKTVIFIL